MAFYRFHGPQAQCAFFYSKMKENRLTGKFTDVNIVCHDNRTFKCHRHTLAVASPYFDTMFSGNFLESSSTDVNLDSNIDSVTFELILDYMYSGSVAFINDNNVYNLLKASDILGLDSVEEACAHYFSQKCVPMDSALDIVQYACAIGKESMMSVISRFLTKHLENSTILQFPFPELSTLLSRFRPHSLVEEKIMLGNICKWVQLSDSTPECNTRENQKATFLKLMQNYSSLSAEFAEDYFDKMMVRICGTDKPLSTSTNLGINCSKSNLYLFTRSSRKRLVAELFMRQKDSTSWSLGDFHLPLSDFLYDGEKFNMRCTIIDGWRFSLYSCPLNSSMNKQVIFTKDWLGSIDSPPKDPPFVHKNNVSTYHICSNERTSIYAFANNNANSLFEYDCLLDQWSKKDMGDEFRPRAMTWYDQRLYIFGRQRPTSITNEMRAYDPRSGQFEKFSNCNQLYSGKNFECTNHRGQIYVANLHNTRHNFSMEVFDPVAGKRMNFIEPDFQSSGDCEFRLLSFGGKLWAFHCEVGHDIRVRRYNSCHQMWIGEETRNLHYLETRYCTKFHLLDAVTC